MKLRDRLLLSDDGAKDRNPRKPTDKPGDQAGDQAPDKIADNTLADE